jgi:uncharacterized protein YutE (UPF0331/DUF86 family)
MAKLKALAEMALKLASYLDGVVNKGYDLYNWDDLFRILHALQIEAQVVIDMAQRAASLAGRPAQSYSEAGEILANLKIFDAEDLKLYRALVGFRNVVVHGYTAVDLAVVEDILKRRLYREVLRLVYKILERFEDPS